MLNVHTANMLCHALIWGELPLPSSFFTFPCIFWDHLPNRLFILFSGPVSKETRLQLGLVMAHGVSGRMDDKQSVCTSSNPCLRKGQGRVGYNEL